MNWKILSKMIYLCAGVIAFGIFANGCTSYHLEFRDPNGKIRAKLEMAYVLQDKEFDEARFDPNTNTIVIRKYDSETSQIVKALLERIP